MINEVWALLAAAGVAFVPVLELRAGIPIGMALGLSALPATAAAVVGNVLQIWVAMAAVTFAHRHCCRLPRVRLWLESTEARLQHHLPLIRRWGWLGLTIFVLLPLPGTGVWGGVVVARLLSLPAGGTWVGLTLGVVAAGAAWGLGAHGVFAAIRLLW